MTIAAIIKNEVIVPSYLVEYKIPMKVYNTYLRTVILTAAIVMYSYHMLAIEYKL